MKGRTSSKAVRSGRREEEERGKKGKGESGSENGKMERGKTTITENKKRRKYDY